MLLEYYNLSQELSLKGNCLNTYNKRLQLLDKEAWLKLGHLNIIWVLWTNHWIKSTCGAREQFSLEHPISLLEKIRGTMVCFIATLVSQINPSHPDMIFMNQGFYGLLPNLADNLLMRFMTLGLFWYLDIFAGFWATSWNATITSGSCRTTEKANN